MGHVASGHGRIKPTNETRYGTEKAVYTIAGPKSRRATAAGG